MILAIDQGTTGSTCIVFDDEGRPAGRSYREFEQHFPRPGWVEHDPAEICGVATGLWSEEDVRTMWREDARYEPSMPEDRREELLAEWGAGARARESRNPGQGPG